MSLTRFWNQLFKPALSDELKINQRSDAQGHHYYHIYDPSTRKSSAFGSEQEVRILLDQQRY